MEWNDAGTTPTPNRPTACPIVDADELYSQAQVQRYVLCLGLAVVRTGRGDGVSHRSGIVRQRLTPPLERPLHRRAHIGGRGRDFDAGGFQRGDLFSRRSRFRVECAIGAHYIVMVVALL